MTAHVNVPFPDFLLPLSKQEGAFCGKGEGSLSFNTGPEILSGFGQDMARLVQSHLAAGASIPVSGISPTNHLSLATKPPPATAFVLPPGFHQPLVTFESTHQCVGTSRSAVSPHYSGTLSD